jgi:hypothetical protein
MCSEIVKKTFGIVLIVLSIQVNAQTSSKEYLERAESMYANVWKNYRVPAYPGLFSENFPSKGTDTLTYMEGGSVREKKVSFLWPFSGMFSATNVLLQFPSLNAKYLPYLDTCVKGMEQYRDTSRSPDGYQAYPVALEKSDRYYDDNGLVGIDYMESYLNTKNPLYLKRAEEVFKFILSGWNNDLGGAVTWLEGHNDQKPACSNGTATLVALKLYEGSKNKFYLNWGKNFYEWTYRNLLDSTGLIGNDKKLDGKLNRTFYTYNTGFMLEAAVLLYKFTGEKQYLDNAKQLARDSYNYFTTVPHDKNLVFKIDLPWFVTVLFRGYEALYKVDGNYQYLAAVEKDLNYAWQHSRDKHGFITHSWTPSPPELAKPKWLLDEGCIAELYARLAVLKGSKGRQQ